MNVQCQKCHKKYDDAERWTICPHKLLMPMEHLKQKDLAISLLGKPVRFVHMPEENETYCVQSVTWQGMVTIDKLSGEFAPELFVVAGEAKS